MKKLQDLERRMRLLEEQVRVLADRVEIYKHLFENVLSDFEQIQAIKPAT